MCTASSCHCGWESYPACRRYAVDLALSLSLALSDFPFNLPLHRSRSQSQRRLHQSSRSRIPTSSSPSTPTNKELSQRKLDSAWQLLLLCGCLVVFRRFLIELDGAPGRDAFLPVGRLFSAVCVAGVGLRFQFPWKPICFAGVSSGSFFCSIHTARPQAMRKRGACMHRASKRQVRSLRRIA